MGKMCTCILVEYERYYQIFVFENLEVRPGIPNRRPWDMGLDFGKFHWRSWDFGKFSVVALVRITFRHQCPTRARWLEVFPVFSCKVHAVPM